MNNKEKLGELFHDLSSSLMFRLDWLTTYLNSINYYENVQDALGVYYMIGYLTSITYYENVHFEKVPFRKIKE